MCLCPLCMVVWQMNSVITDTLSQIPILTKIWLPLQRPLNPCNQKYLPLIGRPRTPFVISNQILYIPVSVIEMHLQQFQSQNYPLRMEVSQLNLLIAKTPHLKLKLCIDMLHTTEVMAFFVRCLPILAKICLSWQCLRWNY